MEELDHTGCVDTWIERVIDGTSIADAIDAFETAFSALWQRAHVTLGEVTLAAIVKRVLCSAETQFEFLSSLHLDGTKINCEQVRASGPRLQHAQLVAGIRFVLVELMTVIGNLTADILTPALHAQLSNASAERRRPGNE